MEIFVRQRRNLVLVSFVLLISLMFHVQLQKFNVLGNEFPFTEPHRASTMLWPLWLYWLIRYFQAFNEVGLQQLLSSFSGRFAMSIQNFVAARLKGGNADIYQQAQKTNPLGQLRLTMVRTIGKYEYLFAVDVYDNETKSGTGLGEQSMKLKGGEVFRLRIGTGLWVTVFTTAITEYILPFIIAAAPAVLLILEAR
ncbi:MAG: hypothetical protein HY016_03375 [Nitrosomonadales bacterium]|nr:hypothetical protein [Nitrosomonadales bacterium]